MIEEKNSIVNFLSDLIDLVVIEIEGNLYCAEDKNIDDDDEENNENKKGVKTTCSQTSNESSCRICYDTSRYPIIYPCKCKVNFHKIMNKLFNDKYYV